MTKRYTKEIHWQAVNRYFKGKQTAAQISHVMNTTHSDGRVLCLLSVSFYPTLFEQSGQHSTSDDKILFVI